MKKDNFLSLWKQIYPRIDSLYSTEPEYYAGKGTQYLRANCPYCHLRSQPPKKPDTKHHLHIHFEDGHEYFKCHRCGSGGSINYLLRIKEAPKSKEWKTYEVKGSATSKTQKISMGLEKSTLKPGNSIPLSALPKHHIAWKYLLDDGFTARELEILAETYGIYYCISGIPIANTTTTHRLIFEISENKTQYGWQARWLPKNWPPSKEDKEEADSVQKYLISPGLKKTHCLYNWDLAQDWDMWIVVEGIKKVWKTGPFSLASFGKSNSATPPLDTEGTKEYNDFWSVRLVNGNRPIGLLYDKDGYESAIKHANDLKTMGADVTVIPLPENGPNDLDNYLTPEIRQLIIQHMGRLPKRNNPNICQTPA